jgi:hypothetical protein
VSTLLIVLSQFEQCSLGKLAVETLVRLSAVYGNGVLENFVV